ncbi:LPS-assembly protein LptD [Neisseria canis]|uniref:LPS-assembly protein LptD n=1 Tax=Neisseria canis TaxID=493 RepID=A0A1X3CV26_9NEIS|nr:LPS-assembly protein LptD [Neisseria canis]OSI11392.1 LPS biosynthesis protein [Neisseria canis]VEE99814.1 OstA protein [Neisseria canis]
MARLFTLKPVVLALGMAFCAGSVYADNLSLGETCLRCDPEKIRAAAGEKPQVKTSGEEKLPADYTRITADKMQGQSKIAVAAQGDVIVEYNDKVLNAAWAEYDQTRDIVRAGDSFVLYQNGSTLTGEKLEYHLGKGTGSTENARLEAEHEGRRLQSVSEKVELKGKDRYVLHNTKFNTCSRGDASWYIAASSIEADYEKGVGVAKNARLVFGGVPVLYTPWADFPLNSNRKSGLLVPTLEVGSDGTEIELPYYFNLAPNYDATLAPGVITDRGVKLHGEFRYLTPKMRGETSATWMPNDRRSEHNNRYHAKWQHQQSITPSVSVGVDFNQVSDDDYFRDFYSRNDIATHVNLNRQIWLNHNMRLLDGSLDSYATIQKHQTLANVAGYEDEPYTLMPRLSTRWQKNFGNLQFNAFGQFTRFQHDDKQSGSRIVAYPSASWNFHNSWGFITPKVGVHYTHYNLDTFGSRSSRSASRVLPLINVDAGVTFERPTSLWGKDYVQTLEPRLFYNYIPTKSQNDLPNFDSSENSFSYEQLFRENLYSGNDRINSSNSLTTAIQTRYLDRQTGSERFRAGIGQKFYFTTDSVALSGSIEEHPRNRSDWIAFGHGRITDTVSGHALVHYNQNQERFDNIDTGLRYNPERGKVVSARYKYGRYEPIYLEKTADGTSQYVYEKLRQVDLAAQWPLRQNLYAVARLNYGLDVKKPLEQLVGLEYKSGCGCWSASVTAQRYVNGLDSAKNSTYKNAVFLNLQLKDLSNIGSNPYNELSRAIPGYSKSNEVIKK